MESLMTGLSEEEGPAESSAPSEPRPTVDTEAHPVVKQLAPQPGQRFGQRFEAVLTMFRVGQTLMDEAVAQLEFEEAILQRIYENRENDDYQPKGDTEKEVAELAETVLAEAEASLEGLRGMAESGDFSDHESLVRGAFAVQSTFERIAKLTSEVLREKPLQA